MDIHGTMSIDGPRKGILTAACVLMFIPIDGSKYLAVIIQQYSTILRVWNLHNGSKEHASTCLQIEIWIQLVESLNYLTIVKGEALIFP